MKMNHEGVLMNTHRLLNWYERVAPWIPYNEGFQTRSTDVSDLLPKYQHDFAQSHGKSELILSRDQAERLVNAIMTMPKAKLADDRAKAAYSAAVEDPLTEFTPEGRPIGTRSRSNIRIKPEPIKTRYGDNWQITWPLHDLYIEPGFHFEGRSFHEDEDPEVPPIWEMPELVDLEGNDLSDEDVPWWDLEEILEYNGFIAEVAADIWPEVWIWSPANIAHAVHEATNS